MQTQLVLKNKKYFGKCKQVHDKLVIWQHCVGSDASGVTSHGPFLVTNVSNSKHVSKHT